MSSARERIAEAPVRCRGRRTMPQCPGNSKGASVGTKLAMVAAAVFAALPSSAFGASVSVNPATLELLYRAAPGELNDVQLSKTEEIVTITDAGPVISVGFGCTQISDHEVACSGATYANIYVGDLDDRAASLAARRSPFSSTAREATTT
jgi:hypothetical protein